MNLTNPLHTYFILILLVCILNEIYGTRIPLEIVQLENSGTRLNDDKIANTEYQVHDVDEPSSYLANKHNKNVNKTPDDWITRFTANRKASTRDVQEPRIFYQVGSSEDDLPICGTNEVCSKIDLYDIQKAWIERQCRCPPAKHHIFEGAIESGNSARNRHAILHNLKLSESTGNLYDFESEHIKNVLMKLGMLHNAEDSLMKEAEDYMNDSESDEINYSAEEAFSTNFPKTRHRTQDNEAIEVVKMTKIRHHNNVHGGHPSTNGQCPDAITSNDGHTIADKTRLYKMCEPVQKLPLCRYFRDYTWTLVSYSDMNVTQQIVHCRCPKNSISYLIKREPLKTGALGYTYLFACSPQSRLKCQRKEPCKLFTVRKRQEQVDEVNTNVLCQCPRNYRCPKLHTDVGVILGKNYVEDNIRTFSGYCLQDIH
ncbi:protein giant-lens [Sitodiplosis mosellana]|uniref:protein giant-lens n=1 Tax=Sitodiplosis mosellana TaxID=263140 RepID=UPI002443D42E|nr:protein giant-lens [Sitodiplosis mosellana]XP_055326671.1 protein giant-lens [Sitodiplosis mosellana]XP_055326672.1 protein giant-lens [Sitodiplosis mosellana]